MLVNPVPVSKPPPHTWFSVHEVTAWSLGKWVVGKNMFSMYLRSPVLSFCVSTLANCVGRKRMASLGFLSPFTPFSSKVMALLSCGCRYVRAWNVV